MTARRRKDPDRDPVLLGLVLVACLLMGSAVAVVALRAVGVWDGG